MKKGISLVLALMMVLALTGCGKKPRSVKLVEPEPSTLYSQEEIYDAMDFVIRRFQEDDFRDMTLLSVSYAGDERSLREKACYVDDYQVSDADQVIVLLSSFYVSRSHVGPMNPGQLYTNYGWILGRSEGGDWEVITAGYA